MKLKRKFKFNFNFIVGNKIWIYLIFKKCKTNTKCPTVIKRHRHYTLLYCTAACASSRLTCLWLWVRIISLHSLHCLFLMFSSDQNLYFAHKIVAIHSLLLLLLKFKITFSCVIYLLVVSHILTSNFLLPNIRRANEKKKLW